ncbi:hypothetical protein B0A52_08322 [Exophiala mesophila]|uniref:AB hydrolase-1 domain-containing protein n=1 Tax=Exophiala mesophila TaxID=212818 RepID=A0A438MTU3_EXOME|nr:hypothetical protein B0A52_08322 [Exophiala mesophila]
MVIFQNKIIYMPSVPPFSRSEKVEDYATQCGPVRWQEHDVKSSDGTIIKLLEGSMASASLPLSPGKRQVVVLYLQGNASSLPPRLPHLSSVIRKLSSDRENDRDYRLVALSYRGFWKSQGTASQPGIELDVDTAFKWVLDRYDADAGTIVVWGQSIGAGASTVGVDNLVRSNPDAIRRISGLLLETPFVDLKAMLIALYPQKFLPYRYLAPFLRSTWDSKTALGNIGNTRPRLRTLILEAGDDEIVPAGQGQILEEVCKEKGLEATRLSVRGALHTEVMAKPSGRSRIVEFIGSF